MIADTMLLLGYFLTLMVFASRESLAALCVFAASMAIGINANLFEPWLFHVANIALYAALCLFGLHRRVKYAALCIVVLHYVMAWDAALFPTTETTLYFYYPAVSLALNLVLLFTIGRTGSNDGTTDRTSYRASTGGIFHL